MANPSGTAAPETLPRLGRFPQAPCTAIQGAIDQPPITILDDLPDDPSHGGGRHWRLARQLLCAVIPALTLRLMDGLEACLTLNETLALRTRTAHEIATRS